MLTTTLSEKGQVVIPAEIRGKAGLEAGQRFAATMEGDRIVFTPLPRDPLLALRGAFAGKDSLTEALLSARREERQHE
ncbi:MAG: AbrB/MazE/SpoVT family DNA-binding domain-containing protein [Peptococcaceae bacterium]|jgi:AbrB family looped-hinge helix DNA binding protein|nr:AbrB/MazE/SpoVT family DNA-binding domain-containing protein [Peptococcaceae bacterium]